MDYRKEYEITSLFVSKLAVKKDSGKEAFGKWVGICTKKLYASDPDRLMHY
ncbi:hypothetical protein U0035_05195 [Niabella yanshanensis]|uniref:Transposase n=1 Tax=Niabella yanshanensis TaxID=577386 RepID=A0ABZ0WBL1_9BACT|nr:hypothetical protein U0035_05195 [Niabella yanshanensis]